MFSIGLSWISKAFLGYENSFPEARITMSFELHQKSVAQGLPRLAQGVLFINSLIGR
jgi:hypothetical protein